MITAPAAILIFVFSFDGTIHFSSHNAVATRMKIKHCTNNVLYAYVCVDDATYETIQLRVCTSCVHRGTFSVVFVYCDRVLCVCETQRATDLVCVFVFVLNVGLFYQPASQHKYTRTKIYTDGTRTIRRKHLMDSTFTYTCTITTHKKNKFKQREKKKNTTQWAPNLIFRCRIFPLNFGIAANFHRFPIE